MRLVHEAYTRAHFHFSLFYLSASSQCKGSFTSTNTSFCHFYCCIASFRCGARAQAVKDEEFHYTCNVLLPRGQFHKAIKPIIRQIVSITIVICIVILHFTKHLGLICSYDQSQLFVKLPHGGTIILMTASCYMYMYTCTVGTYSIDHYSSTPIIYTFCLLNQDSTWAQFHKACKHENLPCTEKSCLAEICYQPKYHFS